MLDEKKFYDTYKENESLRRENESMYMLLEENKDLKEELEGFKNISYEVRMKKLVDENKYL